MILNNNKNYPKPRNEGVIKKDETPVIVRKLDNFYRDYIERTPIEGLLKTVVPAAAISSGAIASPIVGTVGGALKGMAYGAIQGLGFGQIGLGTGNAVNDAIYGAVGETIAPVAGKILSKGTSAAQSGVKNILKKKVFIKEPNSFTRGIGTSEEGLKDLVESGIIRGNPRGTSTTAHPVNLLYPNVEVFKRGPLGVTLKMNKSKLINKYTTPNQNVFKSEIDWGKWNKEIPQNKELLNEYNKIEKSAKESGNWMKNPDGSNFKGTPEQFVQQQSSNFKKAFPNPILDDSNNIQINYHGTKAKNLKKFRKSNELEGWFGTGTYTTPDKNYALGYTKGMSDEGKVLQLYINSNSPQKTIINPFKGNFSKEELTLQPGYDYLKVSQEQVTPFSNYLKSARGNNGMFDMTNPNIYKTIAAGIFLDNIKNKNK